MAGPCAVESREQLMETARCVKREGARVLERDAGGCTREQLGRRGDVLGPRAAEGHLAVELVADRPLRHLRADRLDANGRVLIVEMIIPDDNAPSMASITDMNMLVMLPGKERSLSEYRALIDAAGLKLDRVIQTHSPFQVIEASKK